MKRFNDSIHGMLDVPSYSLIFIDAPAFQRLRNLMQLGVSAWVYPTAVHHRFEHSLGTAYLARLLMYHLYHLQNDENLEITEDNKITEADIKCAELAGLLHDIGHGPFSHVWDSGVVSSFGIKFRHERASIEIIDWMIETYDLMPALKREHLTEDHIRIIKEMIYGVLPGNTEKHYKNDEFKAFMYEIISNGYCELDVDKFDYLARDGKMLGTFSLESATDLQRLIRLTSVARGSDGCYHLAWRNVTAMTVVNVFQVRHRLHRVAYKHKNSIAVELMVADAIQRANGVLRFTDSYQKVGEGEWKLNIPKFLCLTDHIFWQILYSIEDELKESRSILERILRRELYASVAKVSVESNLGSGVRRDRLMDENTMREIISRDDRHDEALIERARQAVIISHCSFDFCMKEKNPVDKCLFINREGKIVQDNDSVISSMAMPKQTYDLEIRLYSRDRNEDVKNCLSEAFKLFCKQEDFGCEPTEM